MAKIVFDIVIDPPDVPEKTASSHRTMPNCPGCGRFCRMYTYQQYNGHFNIWYADVSCKNCGEFTEQLT